MYDAETAVIRRLLQIFLFVLPIAAKLVSSLLRFLIANRHKNSGLLTLEFDPSPALTAFEPDEIRLIFAKSQGISKYAYCIQCR